MDEQYDATITASVHVYPSLHVAVYAAQAVPLLITDRDSQWQKRCGGLMLAALDYRLCVHGSVAGPR